MVKRMIGNEYRTTVVYIESYNDQVFTGYMINPCMEDSVPLKSTMQFVLQLENLLDKMDFPQSFTANREFTHSYYQCNFSDFKKTDKVIASFAIKILFRQNASWQGTVAWLEGNKEESFRSVLELLFLMHSALTNLKK